MPDFNSLICDIKKALPESKILEREPMSRHCSFRIGGAARLMVTVRSEAELGILLGMLKDTDLPPFFIGNGTNLLWTDEESSYCVIKAGDGFSDLSQGLDNTIICGSRVSLARLALFAAGLGLSGLEFAHGIPGTLGGGIFMNAGAYGSCLSDVITEVRSLDSEGKAVIRSGDELAFSYRSSVYCSNLEFICSAKIRLMPGNKAEILELMDSLYEKRSSSQPLDMPSAGSTFKRPEGDFAGRLIDVAGLRGYKIGGAMVSDKHAGFVVNTGAASFSDVINLMEHIKKSVFDNFGVELSPEVRIVR